MIIDCIGCLHGYQPKLEGGDLLIITGDLTARNTLQEYLEFNKWLKVQDYRQKIVIAGNHDGLIQTGIEVKIDDEYSANIKPILANDTIYLEDSGTTFSEYDRLEPSIGVHVNNDILLRKDLKIWGTPHSLWFDGINPECTAFSGHEEELSKYYEKIPENIDILISHTPFFCMLDQNKDGYACGSRSLRNIIDRVKPKFFICSHIHEQGGHQIMYKHLGKDTWCINCSIMNEYYKPVNKPMRITI